MDGPSYIAAKDNSINTEVLIKLVEALRVQGLSTSLSDDLLPKHTGSYYDIDAEKRQLCRDRMKEFKIPLKTIHQHQGICEMYKMQLFRAHKLKQENIERHGGDPATISIHDSVPQGEIKNYISVGIKTMGLDPVTRAAEKRPLETPFQPLLSEYSHCILKSPISKNILLKETIFNLCDEGESNGLTYSMMANLFKQLMVRYYPSLMQAVLNQTDVFKVLEVLLAGMNTEGDIFKVQEAISRVKRDVHVPLAETARIIQSLQEELYLLMSPREDPEKIKKRAERQVKRVISSYVSEKARRKYNEYKLLSDKRNEELSLSDILSFLTQLERRSGYRLTVPKQLDRGLIPILVHQNSIKTANIDCYGNSVIRKGKAKVRSMTSKRIGKVFNRERRDSNGSEGRNISGKSNRRDSDRGWNSRRGQGDEEEYEDYISRRYRSMGEDFSSGSEESDGSFGSEDNEDIEGYEDNDRYEDNGNEDNKDMDMDGKQENGQKEKKEKEDYFCPICLDWNGCSYNNCKKYPGLKIVKKPCTECRGQHENKACIKREK